MSDDTIYVSAPIEIRDVRHADVAWDAVQPFQPLLGQDAQIAAFALAARAEGLQVRFLAAPEIYGGDLARRRLRRCGRDGMVMHVRFGTPRLPRILKGAMNVVLLAEDAAASTDLGRHPFAAGTKIPACVKTVLVDQLVSHLPERIGTRPAEVLQIPTDLAEADIRESIERPVPATASARMTFQSSAAYSEAAWRRAGSVGELADATTRLAERTSVLLPWNLAAPCSLVPNVLEKASRLAAQDRMPLTIVVLPYNDVPGSLNTLSKVAASCAEHLAGQANGPAILWARAGALDHALALVRHCRRAWIDPADPEWRFTMHRLVRCGLPVNLISDPSDGIGATYDPGRWSPDELVTYRPQNSFGQLVRRTRVMSLRGLARLAEAIERGMDMPFRPNLPERQAPSKSAWPWELLHRRNSGANG